MHRRAVMGWGIVAFAVFVVAVAVIVAVAAWTRARHGRSAAPVESPAAEARARYARGDIDRGELDERRRQAGG